MASKAPRTSSATSAEQRASTELESSRMAASRASWFSLILNSREGSKSESSASSFLNSKERVAVRWGIAVTSYLPI